MTFEEAKKILEKEGFYVEKATRPCAISESFIEYEDPTICEAMQVVNSAGYFVCMEMSCFDERKARLKKELAEHSNAPVSGKEKAKEGNPALKESASQFNDALLDEQAKKIKLLGKEISKLNSIIHDKNAVLSDVAEELRLSKIREKNLAELGLKYVGENEELKKELADKVVDKIDAQALKSAESALAWKEKAITYKDMALAYYEKKIAEKDEVIAELREKLKSINMNRHNERICKKQLAEKDEVISDLGNELAATKKELEEKTQLVETVRKGSKEYCDYGIAAEKMIQKMAKEIVNDSPVPSKDYKQYRLWANGYRFNPQLPDFSKEEEKKLEHAKKIRVSSDNAEEGADLYGVIVLCGKDFIDALKNVKDVWQE